jgi:hypothetical protein
VSVVWLTVLQELPRTSNGGIAVTISPIVCGDFVEPNRKSGGRVRPSLLFRLSGHIGSAKNQNLLCSKLRFIYLLGTGISIQRFRQKQPCSFFQAFKRRSHRVQV